MKIGHKSTVYFKISVYKSNYQMLSAQYFTSTLHCCAAFSIVMIKLFILVYLLSAFLNIKAGAVSDLLFFFLSPALHRVPEKYKLSVNFGDYLNDYQSCRISKTQR